MGIKCSITPRYLLAYDNDALSAVLSALPARCFHTYPLERYLKDFVR